MGQPQLWALGALGFALRGGIVLLTLPILVLPTQVEVRLLLGSNLGSTGFSPGFWNLVVAAAVLCGLAALGVVLVLASVEVAAFERLVDDPETAEHRQWRSVQRMEQGDRRLVVLRVASVQALSLLALAAAAVPLVLRITSTAYDEIVRPTSADSIYVRIFSGVIEPLFWFIVAIVLIEMVSSRTTREVLLRATGVRAVAGGTRLWLLPALSSAVMGMVRAPLRSVATDVIAWLVSIVVCLPVVWAIAICWEAVRGAFLTALSFVDPQEALGLLFVALALSATFISGLLLCGFAAAFRAALRSVVALR
jgi:hypothetical protein